jgi:hypothetical protein
MSEENSEQEEYPDSGQEPDMFITDEVLLEKWRHARQTNNDRWQSKLFGEQHGGLFHGVFMSVCECVCLYETM